MLYPGKGRALAAIALLALVFDIPAAHSQDYSSQVRTGGSQSLSGFLTSPEFVGMVKTKLQTTLLKKLAGPTLVPQASYLPPAHPAAQTNPYNLYANQNQNSALSAGTSTTATPSFRSQLSPQEIRALSNRDIRILVDRSASMEERDCLSPLAPTSISRWDWCRIETGQLSGQLSRALPAGITVVPFSSKTERYTNVGTDEIARIFRTQSPGGSTNLGYALKEELDQYFAAREVTRSTKPLLLVVITDGVPNNKNQVKKLIKDASLQITRPNEIQFVFLTVGADPEGEKFLRELDHDMLNYGAAADIARTSTWSELQRSGLARTLARL